MEYSAELDNTLEVNNIVLDREEVLVEKDRED